MQKKILYTLIPIVVLFILNAIYFHPALTGKRMVQDDILLGQAKSREIVEYREDTGDEALWTNAMFSGMPTFQISTKYPNNWLSYVQDAISTVLIKNSSIYIIATLMIGMFFLLRTYKVDPWLSIAGAVAIGFSAFFIISLAAGHNAKVRTAAYIAPTIMGVLLTLRGKHILGFALTALMFGLNIHSNHFQITFYSALIILPIVVAYAIQAFKSKTLPLFVKQCLILVAAAAIGVGPNIGNLWSTMAYTQETMRGGHTALVEEEIANDATKQTSSTSKGLSFDYAMGWSMTKAETFNLFIPMFAGGGSKESYENTDLYDQLVRPGAPQEQIDQINSILGSTYYWGESMTNGGYYVGAVMVFLFVLGMFFVKGPTRQWVVASIVLALLLAWGKHFEGFNRFIFENLPLYNKFRVPSMAVVVLCVVIPFFGVLGAQKFFDAAKENKADAQKKLLYALYITGGVALLIALIGPALFTMEGAKDGQMLAFWKQNNINLSINDLIDARGSIMRSSAFHSLLIVVVAFALLFLYLRGTLKQMYAIAAIVVLVVFDMWSFDKDHLNEDSFVAANRYLSSYTATQADNMILQDPDIHYRVYNPGAGLTSDSKTSFFHKSIGGYHGAKLARYQDLIDEQLSQGNMPSFNMLNAKYFIAEQNGQTFAQRNPEAAGNAWFPSEVLWADSPVSEMNQLTEFDAKNQVVISDEYRDLVANYVNQDSTVNNTLRLTSYDPKVMTYEANVSGKDALAVFSEVWYDAPNQPWNIYIDGEKAELIRVNYLLRAAVIPAGAKEVVMKFEPRTYYAGESIDLVFSIIIFLAIGGAIFFEYRQSNKVTEEGAEA